MCLFARKSRTKLEQNEPYGNACAVISIAQVATRKEVQTMDEKRQEEVMHEFMGDEALGGGVCDGHLRTGNQVLFSANRRGQR